MIQQFPQKRPFDWKQTKLLGDLKFGGYPTIKGEYGYAGFARIQLGSAMKGFLKVGTNRT